MSKKKTNALGNNMRTAGKVASAIGVILSAIGIIIIIVAKRSKE